MGVWLHVDWVGIGLFTSYFQPNPILIQNYSKHRKYFNRDALVCIRNPSVTMSWLPDPCALFYLFTCIARTLDRKHTHFGIFPPCGSWWWN